MSDYNSIQQHHPLRTPSRWTSEERRLIAQLEEIFDDIYRRFGRLRMKDMGSEMRTILQSAKDADGKLTQLESSFNQTAEGFRTDVSRVEKKADAAQNTATEAKSSIEQTATEIRSEVSKVEGKADAAQNSADEAKSSIAQTAENITLSVSKVEEKADEAKSAADNAKDVADDILDGTTPVTILKNASVTITIDGVDVIGGVVVIKAGAKFIVQSGGTVQIDAKDGENSYITLGDMFSVTKDGGIVSDSANFTNLKVKGYDVVTVNDIASRMVVSVSQPDETGVIWFKPTATATVTYSAYTGDNRNKWFSEGHPTNTVALTNATSDTLSNGTLEYTLTVPFYLINDGTESNLHMIATAASATDGDNAVTFECDIPPLGAWEETSVTVTVTSTVNLASDTNAINLTIKLTGMQTMNTYIQKERNITLKISNPNVTEQVMACDVFYLP